MPEREARAGALEAKRKARSHQERRNPHVPQRAPTIEAALHGSHRVQRTSCPPARPGFAPKSRLPGDHRHPRACTNLRGLPGGFCSRTNLSQSIRNRGRCDPCLGPHAGPRALAHSARQSLAVIHRGQPAEIRQWRRGESHGASSRTCLATRLPRSSPAQRRRWPECSALSRRKSCSRRFGGARRRLSVLERNLVVTIAPQKLRFFNERSYGSDSFVGFPSRSLSAPTGRIASWGFHRAR